MSDELRDRLETKMVEIEGRYHSEYQNEVPVSVPEAEAFFRDVRALIGERA